MQTEQVQPDVGVVTILVVDDEPVNCRILRRHLEDAGYADVVTTTDPAAALGLATQIRPDVVLLDVMMPGISGLDVLGCLRADVALSQVPVIILTAASDPDLKSRAFAAGATDFLGKPFDIEELLARVRNAATIRRQYLRLAAHSAELEATVAEQTASLRTVNERLQAANARLQEEIIQRRRSEERFRHHALHDTLTGLPNRALLLDRLQQNIERTKRCAEHRFALVFIDVDDFKQINDTLGHHAGDELLIAISRRLHAVFRRMDLPVRYTDETSARLGGDEFVVLLDGLRSFDDLPGLVDRIHAELQAPLPVGGRSCPVTLSVGLTTSEHGYTETHAVLRDADAALYEAKRRGKGRCVVFTDEMRIRALERVDVEQELRLAVSHQQLFLEYQPIVHLDSGRMEAVEALVRWEHPERGVLMPCDFLPAAERTGLIVDVGDWVLRAACRQLRAWTGPGRDHLPAIRVAVNISPRQLQDPEFPGRIRAILAETGVEAERLAMEITEHAVLGETSVVRACIAELKELGLELHLDDFGTGFSSLRHLDDLPIEAIKIDRSFLGDSGMDRRQASIVHALQTLADTRGLRVVVEGVENQDQLAQVLSIGCTAAQGYFFSRPVAPDRVLELLEAEQPWRGCA